MTTLLLNESLENNVCPCCFKKKGNGVHFDLIQHFFVPATNQCLHTKVLNDDLEGNAVCTDCGLVLNSFFYSDENKIDTLAAEFTQEPNIVTTKTKKLHIEKSTTDLIWTEFILNTCANHPQLGKAANCPAQVISQYAKLVKDPRTKYYQRRDLAAYTIYIFSISEGSNLTLELLHSITGCDIKQVRKLEYLFEEEGVTENSLCHISQLCYLLHMTGKTEMILRSLLTKLDGNCFGKKPRTVAAALIYLYHNTEILNNSFKTSSGKYCPRKQLQIFAHQCQISAISIQKVLPQLRAALPQNTFPIAAYGYYI